MWMYRTRRRPPKSVCNQDDADDWNWSDDFDWDDSDCESDCTVLTTTTVPPMVPVASSIVTVTAMKLKVVTAPIVTIETK